MMSDVTPAIGQVWRNRGGTNEWELTSRGDGGWKVKLVASNNIPKDGTFTGWVTDDGFHRDHEFVRGPEEQSKEVGPEVGSRWKNGVDGLEWLEVKVVTDEGVSVRWQDGTPGLFTHEQFAAWFVRHGNATPAVPVKCGKPLANYPGHVCEGVAGHSGATCKPPLGVAPVLAPQPKPRVRATYASLMAEARKADGVTGQVTCLRCGKPSGRDTLCAACHAFDDARTALRMSLGGHATSVAPAELWVPSCDPDFDIPGINEYGDRLR